MEKNLILKEIIAQNKHWENDKSFFEPQKYTRKLFFELEKYLSDRQIISIVGLRRTGKTILLKQLIKNLIEDKKVNSKNIFFISFDEALITSKLTLKLYLDAYLKNIFNGESNEIKYIFIDEIQYVEKWQHILKRYYDNELNIKFVISGSSSLFLKKKTTESLAGRIYEFKLLPLSFEEFLELAGSRKSLLDSYRKFAVSAGDMKLPHDQNSYEIFLANYGDELLKLFEKYLLYYQFPEMVGQEDKDKIKKYISESIYN
jgi:predicted AAA+ superfamily ATPase